MSEIWLLFIKRINKLNQLLIKSFSIFVKKVIYGGKFFSKSSIQKVEEKKIKWEIQKKCEQLGSYIYDLHQENGTVDFSNDMHFNDMIKKIREDQNFLKSENKN
tara:strand:- start:521 stop:832 length:312 start_codon:yes stop_codon:yes gene_type:complete